MKRPEWHPGTPKNGSAIGECSLSARYCNIMAFLNEEKWDDGKPREPGTLLLCKGDGVLKVWVHDKALRRDGWVTADTLTGLLDALDAKLGEDSIAWRDEKAKGGKRP